MAGSSSKIEQRTTIDPDGSRTTVQGTPEQLDALVASKGTARARWQRLGLVTVDEAPQLIWDAGHDGLPATLAELRNDFVGACKRLEIPVISQSKSRPLQPGEPIRPWQDMVRREDVNAWAERAGRLWRWEVVSSALADASAEVAAETTAQRQERLLQWLEDERRHESRGALARVTRRDGRKRQTVSADIKQALEARKRRGSTFAAMGRQLGK